VRLCEGRSKIDNEDEDENEHEGQPSPKAIIANSGGFVLGLVSAAQRATKT
jgi:hypothetical protein